MLILASILSHRFLALAQIALPVSIPAFDDDCSFGDKSNREGY
jgi:hypothetical protein